MKNMLVYVCLGMSVFFNIPALHATDTEFRDCIILVDGRFPETASQTHRWYLMSRLQAAIAEQAVPILLNASLWNSFIERRLNTEQRIQDPDSRAQKVYDLHVRLNERIRYWGDYYNSIDAVHNKKLIVQQINKEFYNADNSIRVTAVEHFMLLNYATHFDPAEWLIYKNNGGFYLLIPKKYHAQHAQSGFRLETLEEVLDPLDSGCIYFESQSNQSWIDALPDFFVTHDVSSPDSSYMWNIVLSGHGGGDYQESNENGHITWKGEPIIANVSLEEFNGILAFFDERVKTHFLHYTSCNAGGNHSKLIFGDDGTKTYNFALMCGALTDCVSYCKWTVLLPSSYKRFLTCDDLKYDKEQKSWMLPLWVAYRWQYFFKKIASIDFSTGSIERLLHILPAITHSSIADIPLLCMPHTQTFYPLHNAHITKVDSQLLETAKEQTEDAQIILPEQSVLLLESTHVTPAIILERTDRCRFISIQPGRALHYIRKLKASFHVDLPTAFWQAEYQTFDKTFMLDECTFPNDQNSLIFRRLGITHKELTVKNVIILQREHFGMRVFFTIDDEAVMVVARKSDEDDVSATVLSVTQLSVAAKNRYNEYYAMLQRTTALA